MSNYLRALTGMVLLLTAMVVAQMLCICILAGHLKTARSVCTVHQQTLGHQEDK